MKHITFKAITAAILAMAASAAMCGCKAQQDIDITGYGDFSSEDGTAVVDIRRDSEETEQPAPTVTAEEEDDTSAEPEKPSATAAAPVTTKPQSKPAVTITTDAPAVTTPAQTVRTDMPAVTAEPQYTTAATTTAKPEQTEPVEVEVDGDGFPANPSDGDRFTDSTGQTYQYDGTLFFRWIPYNNNGQTIMQEFPSFELSGEKILQ